VKHLEKFSEASHRALRKEALRVARANASHLGHEEKIVAMAEQGLADPDHLVRQEAVRLLGGMASDLDGRVVGLLIKAAVRMQEVPHDKWSDYFAAFERYLIRMSLEGKRSALASWFERLPAEDTSILH